MLTIGRCIRLSPFRLNIVKLQYRFLFLDCNIITQKNIYFTLLAYSSKKSILFGRKLDSSDVLYIRSTNMNRTAAQIAIMYSVKYVLSVNFGNIFLLFIQMGKENFSKYQVPTIIISYNSCRIVFDHISLQ